MPPVQRHFSREIPALQAEDAWLASIYFQMLELAESHFPIRIQGKAGDAVQEDWEVIRCSFMSRMVLGMKSLLMLIPTQTDFDAWNITRVLLENSIHFVWIAGAPDERFPVFLKADYRRRLDWDKDERERGADPPLSPEERTAMRAIVREVSRDKPGLPKMSEETDRDWLDRFEREILETRPFKELYERIYHPYSWYSHPSVIAMQRTWEVQGDEAVIASVQLDRGQSTPFRFAPFIFGNALMVASIHMGWPHADLVKSTLMECAEIHAAKNEGRLRTTEGPPGSFSHYVEPK